MHLLQAEHWETAFSMSWRILGQDTMSQASCPVRSTPMWPLCRTAIYTCLRAAGITALCPFRMTSFSTTSSSRNGKYGIDQKERFVHVRAILP